MKNLLKFIVTVVTMCLFSMYFCSCGNAPKKGKDNNTSAQNIENDGTRASVVAKNTTKSTATLPDGARHKRTGTIKEMVIDDEVLGYYTFDLGDRNIFYAKWHEYSPPKIGDKIKVYYSETAPNRGNHAKYAR